MVEVSLAKARANIHEAQRNNESSYDPEYIPEGPFYRNHNAFHRYITTLTIMNHKQI